MAEKKGKAIQQVIVEVRVPRGQETSLTMRMAAAALTVPSFQLDASYEPVPAGPPTDSTFAAALEAAKEETVFVRGSMEEDKISELEKQPNVVSVTRDTLVAPFGAMPAGQMDFVQVVAADAFGTCPIPPCDCPPPMTAKGDIPEVARYLGVDKIWALGNKGQGIIVGVVDGGITAQGRVAGGAIPRVIGGPKTDWGQKDLWGGHGNMSATDVLGMAPLAQLYDLCLEGDAISDAIQGYQWAITQYKAGKGPHILTNSWGIYQENWDSNYARNPNHPFTRKVVEAINAGILVLFAAGNCGQACPSTRCGNDNGPGKSIWGANGHPLVMTVGAANIKDQLIGYSSQGPAALDAHKPDFCSISHFKGYFAVDNGTSAACPIAAGVVALLKAAKPTLSQSEAKECLKKTAKNLGTAGWDQHSGSGIIQAKAAFDCVKPTEVDLCRKYLDAAKKNAEAYRKTKNKRYLCAYYRYLAAYYCCKYKETKDRRYLCRCYLYQGAYYCCLYSLTKQRSYLCRCYRYYAAYYSCLYQTTKNPKYLTPYRRYLSLYKKCEG